MADTFDRTVREFFVDLVARDVEPFIREMMEHAVELAMEKSPVVTGRYAGNHQVTTGEPQGVETGRFNPRRDAGDLVRSVRAMRGFDHISLYNAVPYALRVEFEYAGGSGYRVYERTAQEIAERFLT